MFHDAGHYHVYHRTCPVWKRTCQPNKADGRLGGPIHINTGWGGPISLTTAAGLGFASPLAPYIAATNTWNMTNGFLRVSVTRAALKVEAVGVSGPCGACNPAIVDGADSKSLKLPPCFLSG